MANAPADAPPGSRPSTQALSTAPGYEWLSRDAAEVDAYVADPWCGWDVPPRRDPSLFAPRPAGRSWQLARIRSDLPILIASGDADPLAAGGVLLSNWGSGIAMPGVADGGQAVPGARHEILNETNRDEGDGGCCGVVAGRVEAA